MPPPPASRLDLETIGDVTVVGFRDSEIVDDLTLNAVRDELYRLVDAQKKTRLVLNLANVRKYSTTFLANLIGLKARLKKIGGAVKLCAIAPNLMDAIKILHLQKELDVYDEEQDAIDSFDA